MANITVEKTNVDTEYCKMYKNYINDLRKYDKSIKERSLEEIEKAFKDYQNEKYIIRNETNIVGFTILNSLPNDSFSKHDIFICEFYIKKEYRNRYYGYRAVEQLTKMFPDKDFTAFIIKENHRALNFWKNAFERLDYSDRFDSGNIVATSDNLIFKYWAKLEK